MLSNAAGENLTGASTSSDFGNVHPDALQHALADNVDATGFLLAHVPPVKGRNLLPDPRRRTCAPQGED